MINYQLTNDIESERRIYNYLSTCLKIFKERENKDDNNNNLIPIILITLLLINKGFNEYKSQFECVGKILILSSIKLQDNQNEIYLETMAFFRSWFFKILINNLNIDNLMTIEEIKIIESWNYEDFKILKKLQIIWLPNDKQNDKIGRASCRERV